MSLCRGLSLDLFAMIDVKNRNYLKSLLEEILNDSLTGWQIHERLGIKEFNDSGNLAVEDSDLGIDSIVLLLEYLYAGWETEITSLDPRVKDCFNRCIEFLSKEDELFIPVGKFDLDEFARVALDTKWPLE